MDFPAFPKIARYKDSSLNVVVTEKLDGTNALVYITEAWVEAGPEGQCLGRIEFPGRDSFIHGLVWAGSRNRWITPNDDNYGFARWVSEHKHELAALGPGKHYGEWWGSGIQRRYNLDEKRFSLFNVLRWNRDISPGAETPPACCHVVPVLYHGEYSSLHTHSIHDSMAKLERHGSFAAPGWRDPEGVVAYFTHLRVSMKYTFKHQEGKWRG